MTETEAENLYFEGLRLVDCDKQYDKAFPIIVEAAKHGYHCAQYLLSQMYARGRGSKKSETKSLEWLRKAAEQEHFPAKYRIGLRLLSGDGIQKDKSKGVGLLLESAKIAPNATWQGYGPEDMVVFPDWPDYALGIIFASTEFGSPDYAKAVFHFSNAAKMLNYKAAQRALCFLEGKSTLPTDIALAERLCQEVLANCCAEGRTTADELKRYVLRKLRVYASMPRYKLGEETKTIEEWAEKTGIKVAVLKKRIEQRLPDDKILASYEESSSVTYQGKTLTIADWSKLSHICSRRLCDKLNSDCNVETILDSQVARVGNKFLYYLSAAKLNGVPRRIAESWHRAGRSAQEIADTPYREIVLEHNGHELTMEDLVKMTHLPKSELHKRIAANWPAERIVTERRRPQNEDVICSGEVKIGSIRWSIGDWIRSIGITFNDLYPYMKYDVLNVDWNRKTVWAAVQEWLKVVCSQLGKSYDEAILMLGEGWSWRQIIGDYFDAIPENYGLLVIPVEGKCSRLARWQERYGFSTTALQDYVGSTGGKVNWDIAKVQEFLRLREIEFQKKECEASKIEWNGKRLTPAEWEEATGIPEVAIRARVKDGWCMDDVLRIPYGCRVVKFGERRYTETMMKERFGMGFAQFAEEQRVQKAEQSKQRVKAEQRPLECDNEQLMSVSIAMAGRSFNVACWLEILHISKKQFLMQLKRCGRTVFAIKGTLRWMSKCKKNEDLLPLVDEYEERMVNEFPSPNTLGIRV